MRIAQKLVSVLTAFVVGVVSLTTYPTEADAGVYSVRVYDKQQRKYTYVDVDTSRPGTNNAQHFSMMMAHLIFPKAFDDYSCLNSQTAYTDAIIAIGDILYYALGGNFCPDSYDLRTIKSRCNGAYQLKHPRGISGSRDIRREGQEFEFITEDEVSGLIFREGGDRIRDPGWVYYGWGDCWNARYVGSSQKKIRCDNSTFGDSKPGVRKFCMYSRYAPSQMETFEKRHFHWT